MSAALTLALPALAALPKRQTSSHTPIVAGAIAGAATTVGAGSRSLGSPTNGRLVAGVHLEESPWLRVVPCYRPGEPQWGLDSLVWMLDRAARAVRKQYPESVLSVGHLSHRSGGEIDRHASHESGRDADVGFYVVDQRNKPIYADHFVAFKGDGTAPTWPGAHFDDERNWAFVASILGQERARVSYIFVASPLRARLLAYAQKIGAPYAIRVLASERMAQPRGSLPHDDHFHVRISCPGGMEGCVEYPVRNLARAAHHAARVRAPHAVAAPSASPASSAPSPSSPPPLPATPSPASSAPARLPVPARAPDISPDLHEPPPAMLDTPIDDVDGVEEE